MTEQYIVWALIVGIALGAGLYWFAAGKLSRKSEDMTATERAAEATWISQTIKERGGLAPADLVDEVLELHADYLAGPALEVTGTATTPADAADEVQPHRPEGELPGS